MDDGVRLLGRGDEAALEEFLASRADTAMFLRSNLRAAGLEFHGQAYGGHYVARWRGGAIVGVACHAWNGIVLPAATDDLVGELARVAVVTSRRAVVGLVGVSAEVAAARAALGLTAAPAAMDSADVLMTLDLDALVVPPVRRAGMVCRRALHEDHPRVAAWRRAYHVELLGRVDGPDVEVQARAEVDRAIADGVLWVLEDDGVLVSMSAFNATLPDMVQVGGVYTPPAHRRRGFAQAVVAGSLRDARGNGVRRAILFTGVDNTAALAAYHRLGFTDGGEHRLVLLREPTEITAT